MGPAAPGDSGGPGSRRRADLEFKVVASGRIAQRLEHSPYTRGVQGSNPCLPIGKHRAQTVNWLDPLYMLAAAVTSPVWARKARADWPARFGKIGPVGGADGRKRLLLHAVSVGEVNALRELVPLLTPHMRVIVSVGTDTGIEQARKVFDGSCEVVRYPVDFSWAVRRFLDAVRPEAVALVELELWPNFVGACRTRGIPVGVINGRLSAKSFRGYRKLRPAMRGLFGSLAFAAVQDETYAGRFVHMGVPRERCHVTGSMKWDTARIEDEVAGAEELARELGIDRRRPLIVAGSTSEGEEALLHAACPEGAQLLCAPRKPERFDAAAADLPGCVRRSRGERGAPGARRFLLDTLGELRKAYALADVVVVGRTFGGPGGEGGSDPIEPIGLGKATIVGPAVRNFEEIVRLFESGGGLLRSSPEDLAGQLRGLLSDCERRRALAERGRAIIRGQQGASERHAEMLVALVGVTRA